MAEWYVKELSKITNISVQTLHHYDRIDLLKPSIRLSNGYRVYSENDLLKLQQIIALKYFGFSLSQVKTVLSGDVDVYGLLSMQSRFLEKKAKSLLEASASLNSILQRFDDNQSIPWEMVVKIIEVYRMTEQLEKSWVGSVLTPEELKEYANFEYELQNGYSESEKQASLEEWAEIVRDIEANLIQDPASEIGINTGKRCMNWVNKVYGVSRVSLRNAIWEKGFKQGYGHDEHGLTKASTEWLDKAIDAYHKSRIQDVVGHIEHNQSAGVPVVDLWNELLAEFCGTDEQVRKALIDDILNDPKISQTAKDWIKGSKK